MRPSGCDGCGIVSGRREFVKQVMGLSFFHLLPPGMRSSTESIVYPMPATDGAFIDSGNDVILMRWQGSVYAFSLACPHQNTALRWRPESGRFQCPKHNSRYQPDGTFIRGRATRGMDRFMISRNQDAIVVHLDRLYSQKDDAAGWAAAMLRI